MQLPLLSQLLSIQINKQDLEYISSLFGSNNSFVAIALEKGAPVEKKTMYSEH